MLSFSVPSVRDFIAKPTKRHALVYIEKTRKK
jgi:hypothetical protein